MDEFTHGLAIQSNRHCTREVKKRMPAFSGPDAAQDMRCNTSFQWSSVETIIQYVLQKAK